VDSVGQRLKEERRRKGWSQRDLARETGVNADTISGIETGQHEPRPSTLRRLAEGLGIEVADFFQEPVRPKVSAAPPSPEWALAASDKEFDHFISTATLPEVMALLPLNLRAKDASGNERTRILERVSKMLSRLQELKGPFRLLKDWEDRSARNYEEREETA
jgi:transcriptional regulator with XRE-family HTH domain